MENIDANKIELKPKKKSILDKVKSLFEDKKKRALYIILFILPFLIAMGIFGFVVYKEAKGLIELAKGEADSSPDNSISSMNYVLRDNATDYQQEIFDELKNAIETGESDTTIAGLVGKNYVADFYTWTNKQGQYDVGGMYYVCTEQNETTKYKENIYMKARDGFYKYLNNYINDYGSTNLIEVENVEIVSCKKETHKYSLYELVKSYQVDENSPWIVEYDFVNHDCYNVSLKWTYKQDTKLNLKDYATSINLLIIENDGRYEIVEASESAINASQFEA